jgi:hypothetical protein
MIIQFNITKEVGQILKELADGRHACFLLMEHYHLAIEYRRQHANR